jgi:hypothetical protein
MFTVESKYTPLLPGEKIRIVFLFQVPSFWPSWESFYHACRNDVRFDVQLVWINRFAANQAQMYGAREFLDEMRLEYTIFDDFDLEAYKAHVVAIQMPYDVNYRIGEAMSWRFKSSGSRVVYIPYGIELTDDGKGDRDAQFLSFGALNAWRIFVISELMAELYKEGCPNRNAVRVLGHPKFDAYANGDIRTIPLELEKKIGGRKVILWKMHFPKSDENDAIKTPDVSEYIKFAGMLPEYSDLFFIFMPHPTMLARNKEITDDKLKMSDDILSAVSLNENVHVCLDADYRPALARADAMIMDRTALMIEAAITGKPVMYMYNRANPENIAKAFSGLVESYYSGATCSDMVNFVEQFKTGADPNKQLRERMFKATIPYSDGRCGERIANSIAGDIESECAKRPFRIAAFCIGLAFDEYWTKYASKAPGIELMVIADNKASLWGTEFDGVPIIEPIKLRDFDFDAVVIFSDKYYRTIYRQLIFDINIDEDRIMRLDKFLVAARPFKGK